MVIGPGFGKNTYEEKKEKTENTYPFFKNLFIKLLDLSDLLISMIKKNRDGPTNGPTDGWTDGQIDPLIEMRGRI